MIENLFNIEDIRPVPLSQITSAVKEMTNSANFYVNKDIMQGLENALDSEESKTGVNIIHQIIENASIASDKQMPICQDTGMAVFFCGNRSKRSYCQ